ncbi:hypothetical protein [Rahnella ecdela]|uniref:hypothetical protein n=1 Tax=Rahnella ecdela TaxID=2816250 RepID=UPI001EE5C4F7|nr:hypothetical protein [Rahnella ecdela]
MLIALSVLMLIFFIYLLMSKKLSALTALIIIPTIFALLGGFYSEMGDYVIKGCGAWPPTG